MAKHLIVIGDGAGGIILANKTRLKIPESDLKITVIGNSPKHYFKPDGIQIPPGFKDYRQSVKSNRFLLNIDIDYLVDEAVLVDPDNKQVKTKSGKALSYDYLAIATGARFTPEDCEGYDNTVKHFYDLGHALDLKKSIDNFTHGNIVLGRAMEPIQCPPASFEMSFLLDQYFREKGIRDKVNIHYLYPMDGTFSLAKVSNLVAGLFEERGITNHPNFNVESIDSKSKVINSYEGEKIDYDLAILVPPHRGQQFLTDSGLADEFGFVDVDARRLNYKDHDDLFVLGDATNVPTTKAGSVAHGQAAYLAGHFASEMVGFPAEEGYNGMIACFAETGMERGISMYYSHHIPPKTSFTSKVDHIFKWTSSDTYFTGMLRGIL